jgi:hypothetical protein
VYSANVDAARHVFPEREVVRQRGYFTHEDEDDPKSTHGSLVITEYPGGCTADEAEAARSGLAARIHGDGFGPIEPLTAGRTRGWGWTETYRVNGEEISRTYIAVFPIDQSTYTVEVYSNDPHLRESARLREIAVSFRLKRS